jgi:hypothetical protein
MLNCLFNLRKLRVKTVRHVKWACQHSKMNIVLQMEIALHIDLLNKK